MASLLSVVSAPLSSAGAEDVPAAPLPDATPATNTEAVVTPPPAGAAALVPTTEIVSMRTAHAKTFATEQPGKFTSRVYANPVHFKDAAGVWQDIDMTLVPQPDGRLRSRAHSSSVSVAPLANDAALGRVDFDADHSVAWSLHGASQVPVQVSGTLGSYASVLPEVSLELRGYWAGLKEDLVLASKAAPDTYLFPLSLRGVSPHLVDGEVHYKDSEGKEWGRTPRGFMQDSRPPLPPDADPSQVRPHTHSEGVAYELVPHGGGTALKVTLDRAWLDDPVRVYPVRVDPTNTFYGNADDTYVQTNDTTRNDTFNDLNVGTTSAGANKMRSFIHFDTGFLKGKAKGIGYTRVATYLFDAWSCASRPNSMYRVTQAWWGGNMASYPGANVWEEVARREVDGCVAHWEQWDNAGILDLVHNWNVSQIWADHGIMLMAYDENDNSQYRHYYSANQPGSVPHLVTDWWGEPNTPDGLSPANGTTRTTTSMRARHTHSDGQSSGQLRFRLFNAGDGLLQETWTNYVAHSTSTSWAPALNDGTYRWDVASLDEAGRWSGWSARQQFTLDRAPFTSTNQSPPNGSNHAAPPTLTARYAHPNPGDANGKLTFNVYATSSDSTPTWSQQVTGVCNGCNASVTVPASLADQAWYWNAQGFEAASTGSYSSGQSSRWSFRIDRTPPPTPVVSSSSHPDPEVWYASGSIQASWPQLADPTGIGGYSVAVDQLADTTPSAQVTQTETGYSSPAPVPNDGQWYLHVRAVDGVGNWGTPAHFGFRVDRATPGAPVITSGTHPDQNAWYTDTDPTFDWSGGDTASGLAGWSYDIDQIPDDQPEGTFSSRSYLELPDGTHTFNVKRLNNAGTWGVIGDFDINVDATPPPAPAVSSSTHPDATAWYPDASPSVSWSATDVAPVDGYSWELNQTATTDPDTASEGMGTTMTRGGLADGLHWLHVRSRNATAAWGATTHRPIRVDAVVETPTVGSSSHPTQTSWYVLDDLELSWSAEAQAQSGVTGWSYTIDGTDPDTTSEGAATTRSYPDLPDGTYTFKLRVLDGLGRWSGVTSFTVNVDTSAPVVSATSSTTHSVEADWYNNAGPTLSWTATDTAPIDGYSWVLDRIPETTPDTTSEGTATSHSWTGLADGVWSFHVRARHATGTWGPTVHRTVRIDTTAPAAPPVSSSTHSDQNAWHSNTTASFDFPTVDDAPVDGYSYVLDQVAGTTPDTVSEGTATTKLFTGLANGTHWFHVRARNGLNMWGSSAHFKVQVDTTNGSPTVTSSTHPSQTAWYSSAAPTLSWSGAYPSGVTGWSYVLDDQSTTTPDTTSEGTATTTSYNGLPDGSRFFHLRARTGSGTWTVAAHFRINVDTSPPPAPPVSSTTHPSQTTWYSNANPSVSFATTDAAPVDGYSRVLDRNAGTVPDTIVDTTASTMNFTGLADGLHWFHVRARNSAGEWGPTAHFEIRVDTTPAPAPGVTSSTHPTQSSWYANDDPNFSLSAADVSGVAGYSYVFDQVASTTPDTVSEGTATTISYADRADGTHFLHVRVLNGSNLWSDTTHFQVRVDDTAPTEPAISSSTHPSQTAWHSGPDATLSFAKSDTAPVDGYSWVLDQSGSTTPDTISEGTASTATVTPADGTSYFHVRARNSSGQWGATAHYTLKTDGSTGSPTITSSSHPDQSAWYPTRTVAVTWTASEESGIAGYSTSVTPDAPGNPGTTVTTPASSTTFDVAEDRVWFFNVRVKSNTGVWGPISSYRIKADSSGPVPPAAVSTSHPDTTRWYHATDLAFEFSASDISGVTGYSYTLDGSPTSTPDDISEGTATTATYTDVGDREWWFHVRARNTAGLWGPARHVRVRVDTTPPGLVSLRNEPDWQVATHPVDFVAEWDQSASPVRLLVCRTPDFAGTDCASGYWATSSHSDTKPVRATYQTSAQDVGQHTYYAFLCDLAGWCTGPTQGSFDVGIDDNATGETGDETAAGAATKFNRDANPTAFEYTWNFPHAGRPKVWRYLMGFPSRGKPAVEDGTRQWATIDPDVTPIKWTQGAEVRRDSFNPNAECANARSKGGADGIYTNVVRWAEMDGRTEGRTGTVLARVTPCWSNVDDGHFNYLDDGSLIGATVTFDRDENWFYGDGKDPNHDLEGKAFLPAVATHEWGHWLGWYGHFREDSSVCNTNDSYNYRTMCPTIDASTNFAGDLTDGDKYPFRKAYQQGYWLVASDGGIFTFGDARYFGSMGGTRLNQPMVGIAPTRTSAGYWTVASDGGIFSFGDARFSGSMGGTRLNKPIVGMAADPDGVGYWMVASDGGIFSFDARFNGSTGGVRLQSEVVGMAATPDGGGYWLVEASGRVHNFGNAPHLGNAPAGSGVTGISMMQNSEGLGYRIVRRDGSVWHFGPAASLGAATDEVPTTAFVGIGTPRSGGGYHLFGWDAENRRAIVRRFGDAPYYGYLNFPLNAPIVGGASRGFDGER
ncbi:MAG: hypothetical protein M3394_01150 [Actinomycetota bacterium]|nr:hypothetical protein [Actinomycetota bacterium]